MSQKDFENLETSCKNCTRQIYMTIQEIEIKKGRLCLVSKWLAACAVFREKKR